jgi:hypothetical protein
MRNVAMKMNGTVLTITVDLAVTGEVSASGKSLVIGSTEGNVSVPDKPEVKVGLNVYTKKSA